MIDVKAILGGGAYGIEFKIFFYNSQKIRASIYITGFRIDSPYFINKIKEFVEKEFHSETRIHKEGGNTFLTINATTAYVSLRSELINKIGTVTSIKSKKGSIACEKVDINDLVTVFENLSGTKTKPEIKSIEQYLDWKIKL